MSQSIRDARNVIFHYVVATHKLNWHRAEYRDEQQFALNNTSYQNNPCRHVSGLMSQNDNPNCVLIITMRRELIFLYVLSNVLILINLASESIVLVCAESSSRLKMQKQKYKTNKQRET